jgi:hypothetical protein
LTTILAACGLYCGACYHYRASFPQGEYLLRRAREQGRDPTGFTCQGCRSSALYIHPGCSQCAIRDCADKHGVAHCGACPEWPCDRLWAFQNDGRVHHLDLIDNLRDLHIRGIDEWLAAQKQRWTCTCGSPFTWYDPTCPACGMAVDSYGSDPTAK